MKSITLTLISTLFFIVYGQSQNCPSYSNIVNATGEACSGQNYPMIFLNDDCSNELTFDYQGTLAAGESVQITSVLSGSVVYSESVAGSYTGIVGPLDPTVEGMNFIINVVGGTYSITQNGMLVTQAVDETEYFSVKPSPTSATLTITTPSGNVVKTAEYCKDFNVGLQLENSNFCNTINVDLPWTIECDATAAIIASGTHSVTVYPDVPSNPNELVDIVYDPATCSYTATANFDCDNNDIGSIFDISPSPSSVPTNACIDGDETFTINYNGVAGGPDCCSTAGPKNLIAYNSTINAVIANSPFGGINNAGYVSIPANTIGSGANALDLQVSVNGYCFNYSEIDYNIAIYVDGVIAGFEDFNNVGIIVSYNLLDIPWYDQNSVVEAYIFPKALSNGGNMTSFTPSGVCGSLNPMEWRANVSASLSVEFEDSLGTGLACTSDTIISFTDCTPDQPILSLATAADCNVASTVEISNYIGSLNYSFSPVGPSVDASGIISGADGTYTLTVSNGGCDVTENFTIDPAKPVPSFTASGIDPTICAGSDGSITLTGLDNNTTYLVTYDENGTTNPPTTMSSDASGNIQITGLSAGTYTNFTVDLNGCVGTETNVINLSDPSGATVEAGVDQTACQGDAITLSASSTPPGATFSWDNGVTDGVPFNISTTTTFTVTADLNGCTSTDDLTVTVTPQTIPTFTQISAFCEATAVPTLPIVSDNGINGTWDGPVLNSPAGTSTYTFTPDASECASTQTMDITVHPAPSPVIDPIGSICVNAFPINLTASPTGGTFSGNGITGSTFDPNVAGLGTHTISYSFTDANGCTGVETTDVVVNTELNFTLTQTDPTTCGGNDGSITISNLYDNTVYNVSYNDGAVVGPQNLTSNINGEIVISGLTSGTYTDFNVDWNGCTGVDNSSISLNDPNAPTVNAGTDQTVCDGTALTLTASNPDGAVISWNNGVLDGVAFTPTTTLTYTVSATLNNCTSSDDVTITVQPKTDPTFATVVDFCENSTPPVLPTTSDEGVNGTWSPANISSALGTATYTFTPDPGECALSKSMVITVHPLPAPTIDPVTDVCEQAPALTLNGTPTGGVFSGPGVTGSDFDPTIAGSGIHTVAYEYTDGNGCVATVTTDINVTTNIPFSLSFTDPTTCNGSDGTITIGDLDAGENYDISYLLNNNTVVGPISIVANGAGNAIITGLSAGSYSDFDVVYKSCSGINNSIIVLNNPPQPTIDAGLDQVVCPGNSTSLSAHNPDNANISWSNGVQDNGIFTPPMGITTYTLTASLNGCIETDQVTITVPSPIISMTSPNDLTANCDITEQAPYADFDAFLADGGAITLPAVGLVDSTSFIMINEMSDGNSCPETVTRTYEITDVCGNTVTSTQNIVINDLQDPTANAPADLTVQCSSDVPAVDITTLTNVSDNCTANPTVTHESDVSDGNLCPEVITRTYNIADDCGNNIDVVQTITIADDIAPIATAPNDTIIQCIGDLPVADISLLDNVSDNCTANPVVTIGGDVSDGNSCPEVITRTYHVEDECGNIADIVQTITIQDDIAPSADDIDTLVVNCLTDIPTPDITVVNGVVDNCTTNPTVAFDSDVSDNNTCAGELITRTYTLTDDCGNTADAVQMILIDNYAPTFTVTGNDPTSCSGSDGSITLSGLDPSTDYQMSYDGGSTNLITTDANGEYEISGLSAGTYTDYTLEETNCSTCSTTQNISISLTDPAPPSVDAGPDVDTCLGATIVLTADNPDNATITWDNGVSDGVGFIPPLGTTSYIVTAELVNCFSFDTVEVTVNPLPIVSAGNDIEVCEDEQVTLTGTGNATTYSWNNGVADGVAFVPSLGTTTYTVTGVSAFGCEETDDVELTVLPKPDVDFVANVTEVCAPEEVFFMNQTIGDIAECKYTINGNTQIWGCDVSNVFSQAGCYDVNLEVELQNGCKEDTTLINYICVDDYPVAAYSVSPDELSTFKNKASFKNNSTGATSFSWDFGDAEYSNVANPSHVYNINEIESGKAVYETELIAYSDLGCADTANFNLPFFEDLIYNIPNAFTPDGNKYNETFKPVFTSGFDPQEYSLKIYNRWGQIIFESRNAEIGWDGTYGVKDNSIVPVGTYVWRIDFKKSRDDERKQITGHVNLLK